MALCTGRPWKPGLAGAELRVVVLAEDKPKATALGTPQFSPGWGDPFVLAFLCLNWSLSRWEHTDFLSIALLWIQGPGQALCCYRTGWGTSTPGTSPAGHLTVLCLAEQGGLRSHRTWVSIPNRREPQADYSAPPNHSRSSARCLQLSYLPRLANMKCEVPG